MNITASTDQLIRQIEHGDTIDMLVEELGMPRVDAIAGIVSIAAGTYFQKQTPKETAAGLSEWHAALRSRCTESFAELQELNPDMPRDDINALPEMVTLNGIRRGVKRAMGQGYKDIARNRYGMELFHRFGTIGVEPAGSE